MTTNFAPKNAKEFICEICDFKCFKNSEWGRHVLTRKHKILQNTTEKTPKNAEYICDCNKVYKHHSSLWNHKKRCDQIKKIEIEEIEEIKEIEENTITPELILNIIQQNQELQQMLFEQNKSIIEMSKNNNTINNLNNNSNNKTFNLNVFLNETCKDAMNIMDFVDSIKIQLCDIESIGELGFVNGMSKLIIKHLNALDENMRPVHCNDLKRESLFVKDGNVWEKEDANNNKLKKAIKYIAHKNICALPEWRKQYPDCEYSESKKSDQYNHIVIEAMGGAGDNDDEKADKIISKIAKTITIDKNN